MKPQKVLLKYWGAGAPYVEKVLGPSPIEVLKKDFDKMCKKVSKAAGNQTLMISKLIKNPKCPKCGSTEFDVTKTNDVIDYVCCSDCGIGITNGLPDEDEVEVDQVTWSSIVFRDDWR